MLLLIPLLVLASANCPYCQWNACSTVQGSFYSCGACNSLAALVLVQIDPNNTGSLGVQVGVCQLCPNHCNSCEYVFREDPLFPGGRPGKSILNCTSCPAGYSTNWDTGKCDVCPPNCLGGCSYKVHFVSHGLPWGLVGCNDCPVPSYAYDARTGECVQCVAHCLQCYSSIKLQMPFFSCFECEPGYILSSLASGQVICDLGPQPLN